MNMKIVAIAIGGLLLTMWPAMAAKWCNPNDNTARVLASANPNDIHKDWRGESYLGLAWSLSPKRTIRVSGVSYIQGDLYSPRGGLVNKRVYVLSKEWTCG